MKIVVVETKDDDEHYVYLDSPTNNYHHAPIGTITRIFDEEKNKFIHTGYTHTGSPPRTLHL